MREQVSRLSGPLGLPEAAQEAVDRYLNAIFAYMRGIYDWHRLAGRYTPHVARHTSPTTPGYLNLTNLATSTSTD
ncbi:hypothetical protein [Streptomyces sp. NPDC059979]|uniref:hypothetical protein n=1 Tax=Streptomyces sp. NPDC059979 TaxID=3347021 RepID=UPI0036B27918